MEENFELEEEPKVLCTCQACGKQFLSHTYLQEYCDKCLAEISDMLCNYTLD